MFSTNYIFCKKKMQNGKSVLTNSFFYATIVEQIRRHSSVGQSTCLTCKGSVVRVHLSPPRIKGHPQRCPFILDRDFARPPRAINFVCTQFVNCFLLVLSLCANVVRILRSKIDKLACKAQSVRILMHSIKIHLYQTPIAVSFFALCFVFVRFISRPLSVMSLTNKSRIEINPQRDFRQVANATRYACGSICFCITRHRRDMSKARGIYLISNGSEATIYRV